MGQKRLMLFFCFDCRSLAFRKLYNACSDSLYLILLFIRFYKHSNITFCINMDSIPAFMEIKSLK